MNAIPVLVTTATLLAGFAGQEESRPAASLDPLEVARRLAGAKYGTGTGEYNCVTLLVKVIGTIRALDAETEKRILIDNIDKSEDLDLLVRKGDDRTKGVQFALVSKGIGVAVPIAEARPGDLVQYWYMKENGHFGGHASVIERVVAPGKVDIYGAHLSTGSVGTLKNVRLTGKDRYAYVVRLK